MTGLRPHRNVVCEDVRDMSSAMKEYRTCSTSWDYTHTVYPTFPQAPNQASSGKKMDSDPDSSSTTACVWWRNPNLVQPPNKGNPTKVGERERELNSMKKKGTLPLLI